MCVVYARDGLVGARPRMMRTSLSIPVRASMKIGKNTVVGVTYDILGEDGRVLEGGKRPHYYLHGGYHGMFPRVEEALAGKEAGDEVRVRLAPPDAFGERDPRLVRIEPRSRFKRKVSVGMQVRADAGGGDREMPVVLRVTQVNQSEVTLDGNHPLAGQTIEMRCKVIDVRPATLDEITHRHVHGPGDEHHHH